MGRGNVFMPAGFARGDFGGRRRGDRLDLGRPALGGVYPRKGKGYGAQGEAAYPDVLDHWDRLAGWQSWRKGLGLAVGQLLGGAERWSAVEALHRRSFSETEDWTVSSLLLAGFTSSQSPEGRWTVTVKPRGTEISTTPVGSQQREFWVYLPPETGQPPLRLLEVKGASPENPDGPLFAQTLIGEVVEDSALDSSRLAEDQADGLGLLCVGVFQSPNVAYFDATKKWYRSYTNEGRLVTRMEAIPFNKPIPYFRPERHLTQALTLSCNCPSYSGLEYARLNARERLGGQNLFPQTAPSGTAAPHRDPGEGNPEGVRRRFSAMPWDRLPGRECKHCHAARWAIGAPMEEPTDMPSPDSSYWKDLNVMAQIEDINAPMNTEWFVDRLRSNLLNEQALAQIDATLLGASVATAIGIMPQRVSLLPFQLRRAGPPISNANSVASGEMQIPGKIPTAQDPVVNGPVLMGEKPQEGGAIGSTPGGVLSESAQRVGLLLRKNESHFSADWSDSPTASFGDWWIGRGTALDVRAFAGPSEIVKMPAIAPISDQDMLPRVIP